jgi:hypothetical protein
MIPDSIPVFLNGKSVPMAPGATVADLVAAAEPDLSEALASGAARATDGRGVESAATTPLSAGAIFRVFRSARGVAPDA